MKLAKKADVVKTTDPKTVAEYAARRGIELAVVGPEAPLVSGVVDELRKSGIRCVGPTRKLAAIEGDKAWCRELLDNHAIAGNPQFHVLTDYESAERVLRRIDYPVAIKPAGLTAGKGVKVSGADLPNKEVELAYAKNVLTAKIGGLHKLVVEELLDGEEYSQQAFVDGRNVHVMPLVQDHKRAYDGDSGPNTGGMGSYGDSNHQLPFISSRESQASAEIMSQVVNALKQETGEEYRGILYGQFMLARSHDEDKPSPKLIEFNCRFGDPEAMNVLPILSDSSDFAEICYAIAEGSLSGKAVKFDQVATVCKYLVPEGYPENPASGRQILPDETAISAAGAELYYASVDVQDGQVLTSSSRAAAVVGKGESIFEAERVAEMATRFVRGPLRHRRDIGTAELLQRRIDHVKSISLAATVEADVP